MNQYAIQTVLEKYDTPLYLFNERAFLENYLELKSAYCNQYSKFAIAYSFKSNYMPAVCKPICKLGGYAEVVSDMEYHMAKRFGFPPSRIIVNGPGKWNGLQEMLDDQAIVMLDNQMELDKAISIANSLNHEVLIGFRLNFLLANGKKSRFGFEAELEDTKRAICAARECKNIRIVGLHFHLGGSRSVEDWRLRAQKMVNFADTLLTEAETQILDLGSGMFGHMNPFLAGQFGQKIPSFEEYADEVGSVFSEHFCKLPKEKQPILIVEPGTTLIANTMCYLTKVIATKMIRGRAIAMVDGSVHQLGELGKKKRLPISIVSKQSHDSQVCHPIITGYTCLEDDILCAEYETSIGVGDILCFENAGAYSNVLKPPFIQVGCKIVELKSDGTVVLAKREETVDDVLCSYL